VKKYFVTMSATRVGFNSGYEIGSTAKVIVPPARTTRSKVFNDTLAEMCTDRGWSRSQVVVTFFSMEPDELPY